MAQTKAMVDSPPPDPDAAIRRDLTHLKVYAVDSEDTMEVRRALELRSRIDGEGGGAEGWGIIVETGGCRVGGYVYVAPYFLLL